HVQGKDPMHGSPVMSVKGLSCNHEEKTLAKRTKAVILKKESKGGADDGASAKSCDVETKCNDEERKAVIALCLLGSESFILMFIS
ncbi:hypothetical protein OS493_039045, partial [Desmophyllum pertusum]